jgi:hypothetical protein
MTFEPNMLLELFTAICVGGGVYAGIRADLAVTRSIAQTALENSRTAHNRIDEFFDKRAVK